MRFVYPNTLQPCLHSTDQRMQTAHFPDSATQNRSTDEVWLVLDCLMRVSYICHESKLCVPHWIYQTEKKLGNNECRAQMQTYLPIQLYTFLSWFQWPLYDNEGECHITTIKVRHCVAMFATEYVHLVSIFTFCF